MPDQPPAACELPQRIKKVMEKWGPNGSEASETEFKEQMAKIMKDIVNFHGEMVLLTNYININYTRLAKILKKYDKRTGGVLRLPFIQKVLQQPFFTTDLISKLVKECESTIESASPQWEREEEVVAVPGDGIFRNTVAALMRMQENIENLLVVVVAQQGFGDDDEVGNSAASAASRAVPAPRRAIGGGKRRRGAIVGRQPCEAGRRRMSLERRCKLLRHLFRERRR
ncbi:SPX domain-containing protein 3-like [Salvia splendens]|uniref:SPX domain-containing protein 3-like n=1 Tax=Salvia splendens TaxID=180675 RepID=UPI001C25C4E8|nr:SPX domain-containing protein 3-like [Salvia splendens]